MNSKNLPTDPVEDCDESQNPVRTNQRVFFQKTSRASSRLLPLNATQQLRQDLQNSARTGYNCEDVQRIQANHPLNTIKGLNQGFTKRFEYKDQNDKLKPRPLV